MESRKNIYYSSQRSLLLFQRLLESVRPTFHRSEEGVAEFLVSSFQRQIRLDYVSEHFQTPLEQFVLEEFLYD